MKIYQVDPRTVLIKGSLTKREITHQADRLEREGQIEPCVVKIRTVSVTGQITLEVDVDHDDHFHLDEAIIQAACWLGWPTILVTF